MTEINNYKIQIQQLQGDNAGLKQQIQNAQGANTSEMTGLKQQINIYITEINSLKSHIQQLQG